MDGKLQGAVALWEAQHASEISVWSPLELIEFTSGAGAKLTRQDDNSIFAEGDRPDKDTYTILARADLTHLRAIRLAVLPDERLPMGGPGRQDNGNLHLSEIRVFSVDARDPLVQRRLAISKARADFDQAGWDLEKAIDGDPNTAGQGYDSVLCGRCASRCRSI